MAIRTTTWRPDTCGCVIEYDWDDAVPAAARVHSFRSCGRCAIHQALAPTDAAAYALVEAENKDKNRAVAAAIAAVPRLAGRHDEVAWAFDGARALDIVLPGGPSAGERTAARAAATALGLSRAVRVN